jgi:1-deoxy-D-xylulose 5-phosphate reductoisomerase
VLGFCDLPAVLAMLRGRAGAKLAVKEAIVAGEDLFLRAGAPRWTAQILDRKSAVAGQP